MGGDKEGFYCDTPERSTAGSIYGQKKGGGLYDEDQVKKTSESKVVFIHHSFFFSRSRKGWKVKSTFYSFLSSSFFFRFASLLLFYYGDLMKNIYIYLFINLFKAK